MKIGIGITTTDRRPYHAAYWKQLLKNESLFPEGTVVYVAHDVRGIAKAKNECLRALKDCDYVFLFDDDCFPIQSGWANYFIDHHNRTGIHHFAYLHDYLHIRKFSEMNGIDIYNNSAGCMMFMTKTVLERVGAYNEAFGLYGYEHVEYSQRVVDAGLNPHRNMCPPDAEDWVYSLDLDQWMRFDFNHHPTLTVEEMTTGEIEARKAWETKQTYIAL